VHRYGTTGIPLVVTWHPAYLLRRPDAKAGAWRDLVLASSAVRDAVGGRVA
jgi:DNA polymerase